MPQKVFIGMPVLSTDNRVTNVTSKSMPPPAHTMVRHRTRSGCVWVNQYSAPFDDSLRSLIRDGDADEAGRIWAHTILRSWGIALDPGLYRVRRRVDPAPVSPETCGEGERCLGMNGEHGMGAF